MRTRHLVSLVTGVLIFSVLVPVCLSIWLAHRQAEEKFVDALDSYASRVLIRTDRVVAQAKQALTHLQTFHAPPCTPPHLREMRRVAFSWRYIQEVMYIDNLKPLCSSLEQSSDTAILPPPMRITEDGYSAWLTSQNDLGIQRYMAVLGKGHYLVMVDPASLVDVVPFGEISMDAALVGSSTHHIFARSNVLDPYILSVVKEQQDVTRVQYNGSMYVQYAGNNWHKNAKRRWQKPGDKTDVPMLEVGGSYATTSNSLIDASYFAIKNITVGYTLPKRWLKKIDIESLRIYATLDNIAMFNHMDGMDPQYNFTGSVAYSYTPSRVIAFGIDLNF